MLVFNIDNKIHILAKTKLIIIKKKRGFVTKIKNEEIFFHKNDLNPDNFEKLIYMNCNFWVPSNPKKFIEKYKKQLFWSKMFLPSDHNFALRGAWATNHLYPKNKDEEH